MQWLAQICQAVAAAHQAGVVHGDLTPNNILLDHNGRIVITDFGFATYAQKPLEDDAAFEWIASPGGTLGFAAPEQISPAFGTIGFTTDIYAIGGLAYYLLTGQSPHDASSLLDTIADEDLIVPMHLSRRTRLSWLLLLSLPEKGNQLQASFSYGVIPATSRLTVTF